MLKRILLAACAAFLGCPAVAAPVPVDGCAKLARIVYDEVQSNALNGTGRAGPWVIDYEGGDVEFCATASKTVSRAFTSAMASAGYSVTWDDDRLHPGDYCAGHYLSQCYPDRYPDPGQTFSPFVSQSWAVVSRAVMGAMYNPYSSNEVRFRGDELRLRIGLGLRTVSRAGQTLPSH